MGGRTGFAVSPKTFVVLVSVMAILFIPGLIERLLFFALGVLAFVAGCFVFGSCVGVCQIVWKRVQQK